jgi:fibronectin type 3 domain-containing protein
VPLATLAPNGGAIDGIVLQTMDGIALPTMYFDEVSLTAGAAPPPQPPAAPAGLTATAGAGSVALGWGAVAGATGYDVYRATAAGGAFTRLTASPQAGTSYADAAVAAGATYWYQVRAVNAAGASPASATVSATVPATPPPPITVTVTPAATTVDACRTLQLRATVAGTTDEAVTWSVQEGAVGGTVDAAGNYTAPDATGVAHVVATSRASAVATATATISYQQRIVSVTVVPASASVLPGGRAQFAAAITTTCGTFPAAQ